jgi:hypothetical protein
MTLPNESDAITVRAMLGVGGSGDVRATVSVDKDPLRLTVTTENGARWVLTLDAAPAAYLAGGLAHAAGVIFA